MLAAYLVCLIVGGVFVALAALSGLGKDVDGPHLGEHELGHGLPGLGHGASAGHGLGHAAGGHGGEGEAQDHEVASHAPGHDVADATGGAAEVTGAVRRGARAGRRLPWLPFTSFRFWTFGSFLFGATGLALTELAQVGEPAAALAALGVGLAGGTAAAAIVQRLRRPVGATATRRAWLGATGELVVPLAPGGVSKIRAVAGERSRDLVVTLSGPRADALPKGTRVVVLEIGEDGVARVDVEAALFPGRSRRAGAVVAADAARGVCEADSAREAREEVES